MNNKLVFGMSHSIQCYDFHIHVYTCMWISVYMYMLISSWFVVLLQSLHNYAVMTGHYIRIMQWYKVRNYADVKLIIQYNQTVNYTKNTILVFNRHNMIVTG